MAKCLGCGDIYGEDELIVKKYHLGDDPWGSGPSWVNEYFCPNCGGNDFEDGDICEICDEFYVNDGIHRCEGWENTEDS